MTIKTIDTLDAGALKLLSCVVRRDGSIAALVRRQECKVVMLTHMEELTLPAAWASHVSQLCYLNDDEFFIWPIASPNACSALIGHVCEGRTNELNLGFSQKIYSNATYVASAYGEEMIPAENDGSLEADVVSIYSRPTFDRVFGLRLRLEASSNAQNFLALSSGHISAENVLFFVADNTPFVWCFDLVSEMLTCAGEIPVSRKIDAISTTTNDVILLSSAHEGVMVWSRSKADNSTWRERNYLVEKELSKITSNVHQITAGHNGVFVAYDGHNAVSFSVEP